jgi:hypothetical protein
MQTARSSSHPRWLVPLGVAGVAVLTFVAFWIGGHPDLGAAWAAVSIVFALLLLLGGRSDTVRLVRGDEDDERTLALELQATTITAVVLVVALAGLFLAAGLRGESGVTFAALLFLAEVTHIAALAVLNRKGPIVW